MTSADVMPQEVSSLVESSVTGDKVPAESEGGSTPRSIGSPHIGAYRPPSPGGAADVGSIAAGCGQPESFSPDDKADDEGWTEVKKSPKKAQGKAPKKAQKRAGSGSSKLSRRKGQARVGNASNVLEVPRTTSRTTS